MPANLIPASLIPIVNGLLGTKLFPKNNKFVIQFSLRHGGKDISANDLDPKLKGKEACLFVHGLMADERIWSEMQNVGKKGSAHLFFRYNTGLHISTNGRELASLVEMLQQRFRFTKLHLIGHSMGGLVIRSACFYAKQQGYSWTKYVRSIFLLAVPHDGAVLEKMSHATSFLLRRIGKFQLGLVGNILEQRSDGIKDLRLGSMRDEDWTEPKKAFRDHFKRAAVPALPGVRYYLLIATLGKDDKSFIAKYLGDGLVTQGSARSDTLLHAAETKVFASHGHNALVRSKAVVQYISEKIRRS